MNDLRPIAHMGAAFVQMGDIPNAKLGYGYALQDRTPKHFCLDVVACCGARE